MKFGKLIYLSLFIFPILGTTISITNASDAETSTGFQIRYQPNVKNDPIYFGTIDVSKIKSQETFNFLEDMYYYYKNTPESIRKGGFSILTPNNTTGKIERLKTIKDYTKDPLYIKYKLENNFLGNFNPSDSIKDKNDIKILFKYIAKSEYIFDKKIVDEQ